MNTHVNNCHQVNHPFPQPLVCPNGHGGTPDGGRFCIRCGVQMVAWQTAMPRPVQPVVPVQPFPQPMQPVNFCHVCGGNGRALDSNVVICRGCRWLRPLAPGYNVDPSAFQWAQDGQAMATLRSMTTLTNIARSISDKAGRRWIETTFNGVRLSEKQMPEIFAQAIRAARILGMTHLPDVYVSGERPWDALTFGSDQNAFIVLGSALTSSFQGDDMLFLLAREMGHCRAGHALWKTVIRFLVGEQGPKQGMMTGGLLGMLDPGKWIEGALEMPLLGWARQAEITADRAGLLAVGNEDIARRVLLTWSLKSPLLYRQINTEAWLEQQADEGNDETMRLTEMMSSSTPYITRRLKLMSEFTRSNHLQQMHSMIRQFAPAAPTAPVAQPPQQGMSKPVPENTLRIACLHCQAGMRIPRQVLAGKDSLSVRCPNPQCGKVNLLKLKQAAPKAVNEEQFAD
ncbi:MAG TPA: M48 family metallopeptidase [Blastocatellia bacterium]|nr:M48 family metallopeptidase [Blastocatellia bacterium]